MNSEQLVLINSLIAAAARMAGLEPTRGNFDGDGTTFTWRCMEVAEPIIAYVEVYVLPDEGGEGAEIKVRSASYDYKDRSKSYSRLWWGRYVEYNDLTQGENMGDMVNEMGGSLSRAWQDLPQQVALLPQKAGEMRAFKEKLRNMGLLQE